MFSKHLLHEPDRKAATSQLKFVSIQKSGATIRAAARLSVAELGHLQIEQVYLACTAKLSCLACNRTEQRPEWASLYFCRKTVLRWNCGRRVIV